MRLTWSPASLRQDPASPVGEEKQGWFNPHGAPCSACKAGKVSKYIASAFGTQPLRASAGASSASPCCQSSFAALRLHKHGKAPYLYLILRLSFPFLRNCCRNVRGFRERGGEQKAQGSSPLPEGEGWRCPSGGQQVTEMHQRQQVLT